MSTDKTRTIDSWLATHAAHTPDKTALRFEGRDWSYAQLHEWIQGLAATLAVTHGLKRGDRLAFLGQNSAAEVALLFAAARLGLIFVPLNWRLSTDELGYIVENSGAAILIYGEESAEAASSIGVLTGTRTVSAARLPATCDTSKLPVASLSDPYLIVYTSGTTGRPKGAVLTQEAVLWNALISTHAHDLTAQDHILNILPLFHVGGINIQMMPAFLAGASVTLHAGFDPGRAIAALAGEGITVTLCVPAIMKAMFDHPDWNATAFPKVRLMAIGSTDVPVDILQKVNGCGIPMVQIYGATETGPVTTYQRAEEAVATLGSIGRPGAHVELRLVGSDGTDCADHVPGEIWVRAPNIFSHYWQNPEATASAVEDGWFKTGDVARRDENGLLWFVGRIKHVIISGGENIYPAEIERLLSRLPGLCEVAVVGRADPRWGEVPVVVAAIEAGGPDAGAILAACENGIARFKRPRDVVFVPALPRNAMGKVMLDAVRTVAANATAQGVN